MINATVLSSDFLTGIYGTNPLFAAQMQPRTCGPIADTSACPDAPDLGGRLASSMSPPQPSTTTPATTPRPNMIVFGT